MFRSMFTSDSTRLIETHLNESLEALDDASEDDASEHDITEARRLSEYTLQLFQQSLDACDPLSRQHLEQAFGLRMTYLRSKLGRLIRQHGNNVSR